MSIKAKLIDDEGLNVLGTNKVCVKVNGVTYKENNETKYFYINNGVVDFSGIKVSNSNVKNITLVTGGREAYLSARDTTSNIVKS